MYLAFTRTEKAKGMKPTSLASNPQHERQRKSMNQSNSERYNESNNEKNMNKEWHKKHHTPKNATVEQRIKWHLAHSKECGCRPIPSKLLNLMKKKRPSELLFDYSQLED